MANQETGPSVPQRQAPGSVPAVKELERHFFPEPPEDSAQPLTLAFTENKGQPCHAVDPGSCRNPVLHTCCFELGRLSHPSLRRKCPLATLLSYC